MPGPIQYKKTDPDGKGRGSGGYYRRSKKLGWSKRNTTRDSKRKSSTVKRKYTAKKGKVGSGAYAHLHDTTIDKNYVNFNKKKIVNRPTRKRKK